jgi:hypothetical protein
MARKPVRGTDHHLIVFSLRDLPDELKAAGTLLTLDAVWRQVSEPAQRHRRANACSQLCELANV